MNDLIKLPETITKAWIDEKATSIVQPIIDGAEYGTDAYVKLKTIAEVVKKAMDLVKQTAFDELSEQGVTKYGAKVEVMKGKRSFDYSNDPVWEDLDNQLADRETFLKGLTKPMAETDGGEIIYPAVVTYANDSVKITFKKA